MAIEMKTMTTSTPGDRIKRARNARDLTQADVARHFGISRVSVTQWESDVTKPEADKLQPLADLLETTVEWIMEGRGAAPHISEAQKATTRPTPPANAKIGDRVQSAGRMIPVYGQAVGGIDGEFAMNGNVLYEVMCPPSISPITQAYAVSISGDSMEPRYFDGEIAFVDPSRRVKRGDFVVAQIQMEEEGPRLAYVKRFVRHNATELVLEQFNPPKELRFPHENVASVHFVVMAGAA